jgi:hypothetical protein
MVGNQYWSKGIAVRFYRDRGWAAEAEFYDRGVADPRATQGTVKTRYPSSLRDAIDTVKLDVERLGIVWQSASIYYDEDGDLPPNQNGNRMTWIDTLREECHRLGWVFIDTPEENVKTEADFLLAEGFPGGNSWHS